MSNVNRQDMTQGICPEKKNMNVKLSIQNSSSKIHAVYITQVVTKDKTRHLAYAVGRQSLLTLFQSRPVH